MKNSKIAVIAAGKKAGLLFIPVVLVILQGCASCVEYMGYDDILNTWVGAEVSRYESRTNNYPASSLDRPQNMIEYRYNNDYVDYSGTRYPGSTWLTVDRSTGKISTWRYEGDCYMHGYCARREN